MQLLSYIDPSQTQNSIPWAHCLQMFSLVPEGLMKNKVLINISNRPKEESQQTRCDCREYTGGHSKSRTHPRQNSWLFRVIAVYFKKYKNQISRNQFLGCQLIT